MRISIITAFPQLYNSFLTTTLIGNAVTKNIVMFNLIRFADLCPIKIRIDEPTAGPGPGMVIKPTIIEQGIAQAEQQYGKGFIIFFSPQGRLLTQPYLKKLVANFHQPTYGNNQTTAPHQKTHLILICPRYEGVDMRVEEHYADAVISIGDYVLMGGDLPAQVFIEGLLRLLPNVIGNQDSIEQESFESAFFDHPSYGQEPIWKNQELPAILRSGNHAAIKLWRDTQACKKTILNRFDWFCQSAPTAEELKLATSTIPPHYAVLMHSDVMIKGAGIGNSSVTSIDLHDIARSAATYGLKNLFMVSALTDQHAIMKEFFAFWKSSEGAAYNPGRSQAVCAIEQTYSLDETINWIEQKEGKAPLLIATSAKNHEHSKIIDYHSQGNIWKQDRPVLFLLGTAQGLANSVLERCDYLLVPLYGMTNFNHLSVRSAAALIFDRWLGLNPKLEK